MNGQKKPPPLGPPGDRQKRTDEYATWEHRKGLGVGSVGSAAAVGRSSVSGVVPSPARRERKTQKLSRDPFLSEFALLSGDRQDFVTVTRGKPGRTNFSMELPSDESRILVIYTGGTIGMLIGSHGYSPEPYFLTEFLRSQARFHDPLQDSLFSNAGSSSTYREWSNTNSGRNSPSARAENSIQHTLRVRSARKVGRDDSLVPTPSGNHSSTQPTGCTKISEDVYECHLPSLVTPRSSSGQGGKRIRYAILEVRSVLVYNGPHN